MNRPDLRPLFVDLDATLSSSDLLADATVLCLKNNPFNLIRLIGWLWQGRAPLKRRLAEFVTPDFIGMPYRKNVIEFLQGEKVTGRPIILATATDELWANRVASEVDLFDDVLASNGHINLKGERKLEAIQTYCSQRGFSSFDYIGDSVCDIPIWENAEIALTIDRRGHLHELSVEERRNFRPRWFPPLGAILQAMRPQQWVKNLLLFTPLMMAHHLTNLPKLLACAEGVIAFCLCASAIYVVNDVLDTEADRRHPAKKERPFASGRLPVIVGPPLAFCLASAGLAIAFIWLPADFQVMLIGYLVVTTLYSFWLKSKVMIDVLVLAGLYASRVLAGGMAAGVIVSEWMLSFSMFIFTSLAFAKRYSELTRLREVSEIGRGRGYRPADLPMLSTMGAASGCLSVLVLALYLNGDEVRALYYHPSLLWFLCPLMLYWIGRLWIAAGRGVLPDDPVAFAVTDRVSWVVALLACAVLLMAASHPV